MQAEVQGLCCDDAKRTRLQVHPYAEQAHAVEEQRALVHPACRQQGVAAGVKKGACNVVGRGSMKDL